MKAKITHESIMDIEQILVDELVKSIDAEIKKTILSPNRKYKLKNILDKI